MKPNKFNSTEKNLNFNIQLLNQRLQKVSDLWAFQICDFISVTLPMEDIPFLIVNLISYL